MHPATQIAIGRTSVTLHPDGLTVTRLPDGREVHARPQDNPTYRAHADAIGYGDDATLMSREHEVAHSLLAFWLGLPESPTLRGVALGHHWPHWQAEEAAVLGLQRFARMAGADLMALAAAHGHRARR